MKEIVEVLLQFNNLVKLHHWKETSYARHVALGDYYSVLDAQLDRFVESVQGEVGLLNLKLAAVNPDMDIIKASEVVCERLAKCECESWIKNQLDEIQTDMYQLKYKLKNLK